MKSLLQIDRDQPIFEVNSMVQVRDRLGDFHRRHVAAGLRLTVGLLHSGATGGEGRSDGRAQI